ncbi:MAG: fimbrillin family protein [Alistipes sp.]|nr:fimbrillin family protein [Alistipes sp.]
MKKLFVSALAILGLVACAKDDVVSVQDNRTAIGFDTFVENVTRVGYTTDNLDGFDVWAYMGDTRILNDEDVEKVNGVYTYGNTQYWIPGQDYFFAALAPLNLVNVTDASNEGLGEIGFTNVDGTEDLIYSTYSVTADGSQDKVNFQFNHLLSKVKFSFVNAFDNANYAFTVENIKMTAPESASIDLTAGGYTWYNHADKITLDFGVTQTEPASKGNTFSSDDLLTIPAGATQEYNVTFDVNLYVAGTLARTYNKEAKIKGIEFVAGKGYSLTATINADTFNLEDINFDATVEDWDETSAPAYQPYQVEVNGVNYDDFAVAVAKAMELDAPVNFFQHVVVDANTAITVPADEELTLNLNGYTLTGVTEQAGANRDMFIVYGTMNVNGAPITRASAAENGTISVKHIGTDMGWGNCTDIFRVSGKGKLNLNDVTAKNIGGTKMAYVVDMSNANDLFVNINNSTLESPYIPVRLFNNAGKHTVTIKNTSLTGKKCCVWVQYGVADGRDQATLDATVFLNVYNPTQNNTFTYTGDGPVLYGFNEDVFFDENGMKAGSLDDYDDFLAALSDDTWYTDDNADATEFIIEDIADYAAFVEAVNTKDEDFAGKTIKLANDIDLYFKDCTAMADSDPVTFRPIGDTKYGDEPFRGTFDGQGHTIKNLYQNGWDLGYQWGVYGSYGLFGTLEDATVKNVVIEGSESYIEGGDVSFIAGSATGDCVFENITINSGVAATYNNGCGGIIGWSGAGNYTFKNITIGEDAVLGGLWGSFDSSIGGIVGQAEPGATYNFENVTINCRIDAYNDCTASYDYYNYRMCGMIIGRCEETTTIDGKNYPDLSKYNMTFNNVTVNYGDWMNYHYCRRSGERAVRIEPGYSYGGAENRDHSGDNAHCMEWIPFNQLIGGDQYAVKGLPAVEGVTVNYPESFYDEQGYKVEGNTYSIYSGKGFKTIATTVLADGTKNVTIELAKDIDLAGIEWPAVSTKAAFVLDGKGHAIKNLTTFAVEDHGFYSTALFTSTRKATTIKNLVVENATVTGKGGDNSHGAVLVACNYADLTIEKVTVKGSTVSNCDRSSVLVTYLYFTTATVKDCVVEGCTVDSIGTAGALLGMNNSHDFTATGNTVKGTTISSSEGSNKAGILIGTWQDAGTLTESGNTVENSKAINAGTETNNNIGRHA